MSKFQNDKFQNEKPSLGLSRVNGGFESSQRTLRPGSDRRLTHV